jgi:hypothetical protein
MRRPGGAALTVLAVQLMLLEPLGFAFYASTVVPRVFDRGPSAVLVLLARLAAAALAVAAGIALWNGRPGRVRLAQLALLALAGTVPVSLLSSALPNNRPPGTSLPTAAGLIACYGAWLLYLRTRDE